MNNLNPLVSIAIPCYNHGKFVQQAIQSVIDQDYQNIEFIIIDDGSQDNSVQKIQEMIPLCKNRFKRFEFKYRSNKGLCSTLNEILEWCMGEYFASLASDDIIMSYKTSIQVNYLNQNPHILGVFGGVQIITSSGKLVNKIIKNNSIYNFEDIFLHNHNLPAATQLLRLNSIKKVGRYKHNFLIEDWYMWLKLTNNGENLAYISQIFACYRQHDQNFSSSLNIMHVERLKIVELYHFHKKYKLAKASVFLAAFHENLNYDILKALSLLITAIKIDWLVFLRPKKLRKIFFILASKYIT